MRANGAGSGRLRSGQSGNPHQGIDKGSMNLSIGIALLALFGLMIWFGKPKGGVQPFFMQNWIIGTLYTSLCLLVFVLAVAAIITSLA
jgi:hypothetical protein